MESIPEAMEATKGYEVGSVCSAVLDNILTRDR